MFDADAPRWYRDTLTAGLARLGLPPDTPKRFGARFLLPGEKPSQVAVREERLWLTASSREDRALMDAAAEAGIAVTSARLRWASRWPVVREPQESAYKVRVWAAGSVQAPAALAELVDDPADADLLVRPDLPTLLDGAHRGTPSVVVAGTPEAEYVEDGVTGLVLHAMRANGAVRELCLDRDYLRALTCPQPGYWVAHQRAFLWTLREHFGRGRPRVIFAHGKKAASAQTRGPQGARGVRYQALVAAGARVEHIPPPALASDQERHDFVLLGGRVDAEHVRAVHESTTQPLVLAMSDAIIGLPAREKWFRDVIRYVDVFFSGEPVELLRPLLSGHATTQRRCLIHQLHQAPLSLVTPQRGTLRPGYRGPLVDNIDLSAQPSFFANHWYPRRKRLVGEIARAMQTPLRIVGARPPGLDGNVTWARQVRGADYANAMAAAPAVLSTSIVNDRSITSVRLFEACSVGAYVVAERFPGCEELYPADCVSWFNTAAEAAALLDRAERAPKLPAIVEMRQRAMERTWRRFSAHDRMTTILETLEKEGLCAFL